MTAKPLPPWVAGVIGAGMLLSLRWLEGRRPLRRSVETKIRREARNLAVAGVSAVVVVLAERPIVMPLSALVEKRRWGILRLLGLPLWLEITAACVGSA